MIETKTCRTAEKICAWMYPCFFSLLLLANEATFVILARLHFLEMLHSYTDRTFGNGSAQLILYESALQKLKNFELDVQLKIHGFPT